MESRATPHRAVLPWGKFQTFVGSPGASFTVAGPTAQRNGAVAGAGISFVHKSGFSTSIKYIGEYREDYISNGVLGELRFVF
jgi:uncharacterized protein with beta-barrel porin domain